MCRRRQALRRHARIENFVDNPTLVQFNHRMTAYLLLALAILHWLAARGTAIGWGAGISRRAILVQGGVGVLTLLLNVPLWAGLLHQLLAALLLISAVIHAEKVGRAAGARAGAACPESPDSLGIAPQ